MKALKNQIAPGAYDIPNDEYHAMEGVSSSHLKPLVLKSAKHYQSWLTEEPKDSNEMTIGSAIHCLVLEPHLFDKQYVVCLEAEDKRSKEYKKAVEENPGKIILTGSQYETITNAATSIAKHLAENPDFQALLDNEAIREKAFFWTDPDTGVLCKVKPDILTKWGVIVDIKSTRDASFDSFQKSIVDFGYFISAPFYLDGIKQAIEQSGDPVLKQIKLPSSFLLIAVETSAPYDVVVYYLDQNTIEIGRSLYKKALKTYAECQKTGQWPGFSKTFTEIGLPNWAIYKLNRR